MTTTDERPAHVSRPTGGGGYVVAALSVVAAAAVGILTRGYLSQPDFVMMFLLTIMVAAYRYGRGPSLVAAALSVAAYDFFFVLPLHTFSVEHGRHLLTFAMMFAVGLVISGLTSRLRRKERDARTEEMRSALLGAVSHDLRTPLGAIVGAGSTLRDESGRLAPAQRQELCDTICSEAERMERLVANILDMVRLESGGIVPKREWVPLEETVGSALSRLEARLGARAVRLDLPPQLPLLSVDPVLFGQVFINLIENVIKHGGPDAPLEIAARTAGATLEIEVADRGPGLPAGAGEQVFEKFYRGPAVRAGGVGLGLAICRGIVHAHGGTITAANREGGGAVFRIAMPLQEAPPAVAPTSEAETPERGREP